MTKNSNDYAKLAEQELDRAHTMPWADAPVYVGRAQVYATLALVQATKEAAGWS